MYSYDFGVTMANRKQQRNKSSSSLSSCEYPAVQTVVTALIEPLPEEKSHISYERIKTKKSHITTRKKCIDFDKIEVYNPINSKTFEVREKRPINMTRTLLQLNQNMNNEINRKRELANIKNHHDSNKLQPEFKENANLIQERKIEVQDKQKRIANENDILSSCKKQKTTKSPGQNIENLSKAVDSPKLLAKETSSSEANEESEEIYELSEELENKPKKSRKARTNISKENQTLNDVNKENKCETINSSFGSSNSTMVIPKMLRTINSDITEIINVSKSDLDENENCNNSESNTLINEWIMSAQNDDTNSVIRKIGETILYSHANNVKSLLEVIRQPVNPSLINLYEVLMQLNDKLSNYYLNKK